MQMLKKEPFWLLPIQPMQVFFRHLGKTPQICILC